MNYSPAQRFRLWRHICGFTQKEAAAALGYGEDAIISIENDRMPLSGKIARCATAISGVDFFCLMGASDEGLTTLTGEEFTRETYLKWPQSRYSITSRKGQGS